MVELSEQSEGIIELSKLVLRSPPLADEVGTTTLYLILNKVFVNWSHPQ